VACVGTGSRTPIPVTTTQDGLKGVAKDQPPLEMESSVRLISREAGDFDLASLYLSNYLKVNTLPALQFYNNDEIVGEMSAEERAEFVLIPAATNLNVTQADIDSGEVNGNTIASNKIVVGQVWSLKKISPTHSFSLIFQIISYKPGLSLKIEYKLKEFFYRNSSTF